MPTTDTEATTRAEQLRRDAEAAEDATLWRDAVDAYEACLSLVAADEGRLGQDEAALLTGLGRCYWNLSEARPAWRALRRAITLCQERGDAVGQARAAIEITRIWGPPDRQKQFAEEALAALEDADPYLRARLLLRSRWFDEDFDTKFNEAMEIADRHGYEDLRANRIEREAWMAADDGRLDDAIPLWEQVHRVYDAAKWYEGAAGTLRNAGFNTLAIGQLDRGYGLAERSFRYASDVHMSFAAQLALLDMAGVHYARGEFEACEELLARLPGESDFRVDFYRMWMAEARGDTEPALRLMVDPDRAGRAPGAEGQVHAASAGVLYRAGRHDGARAALRTWVELKRAHPDDDDFCDESPALIECLIGLGDEDLWNTLRDAFRRRDDRIKAPIQFSTLQGRAEAPVRGALALALGRLDEAERHYRDGLAWCEAAGCAEDAARCSTGLGLVASRKSLGN